MLVAETCIVAPGTFPARRFLASLPRPVARLAGFGFPLKDYAT
jgi:hypothetical protein